VFFWDREVFGQRSGMSTRNARRICCRTTIARHRPFTPRRAGRIAATARGPVRRLRASCAMRTGNRLDRGRSLRGAGASKVAGPKRRHEEATRAASRPAEPRRTQEMRRTWHPAGQLRLIGGKVRPSAPPRPTARQALGGSRRSVAAAPPKAARGRDSALRPRRERPGCARRAWRGRARGRRA